MRLVERFAVDADDVAVGQAACARTALVIALQLGAVDVGAVEAVIINIIIVMVIII